uniref:NADH-ubiquinone oxidoreductase chain 4L n=1 Tax=Apocheima cinerarius TaxID=706528 RepID=A0A1L1ZM30_APOCI|nr:NADH dehydrogenase subunit 4L [Apocheima cinerarius]
MIKYMYIIVIFMFIIGNLVFVSKYKHLLIILLSLEFMVLSVFFFLLMYLLMLNYEMYILMVFLVFSVWEGALGLSILVPLIRTQGNDYFKSFNLL